MGVRRGSGYKTLLYCCGIKRRRTGTPQQPEHHRLQDSCLRSVLPDITSTLKDTDDFTPKFHLMNIHRGKQCIHERSHFIQNITRNLTRFLFLIEFFMCCKLLFLVLSADGVIAYFCMQSVLHYYICTCSRQFCAAALGLFLRNNEGLSNKQAH